MASLPVSFHPEAVLEAIAAFDWYSERSGTAASRFLAELNAAVTKITAEPDRWPSYIAGTRRCLLRRFPFIVVYRQTPAGTIEILAVAHGRRRPGYWKSR
jgi:plasmid stabilization system protein ParE